MTKPMEIIATLCQRYQAAVSANDSAAYGSLFAPGAIRVPPGGEPEHGPEAIAQSEQSDYDVAKWSVRSRPLDAMGINDEWVYGVAEADITLVEHEGGATKSLTANKTWLVQRQPNGEWLIKRQMWNYR
ncbi:MAG: DUF4440 domain-containing protein [Alphaproteobacteria bacterium]|jgi:uncharacterized protein (TIGR02246 family)|nr:DUF4440 domain-containing protein [Alphaproteobacteria bacterium]MDP6830070.1 DUF4440 domain-containing protein [Alphaproteobacteria bacterium]